MIDNRTPDGRGFALRAVEGGAVELSLSDGRVRSTWASDPGTVQPGKLHHIVAITDGGPKIISFVIDGKLNDGGEARQFGWGRYDPYLRSVAAAPAMTCAKGVQRVRLYSRAIRVSEAIAAFHAGSSH